MHENLAREKHLACKIVVVEPTMAYIDDNKPSQIYRREVVNKEDTDDIIVVEPTER